MNDLLDKLKSLGLKIDTAAHVEKPVYGFIPIENVIQGDWLEKNGKRVFLVEKHIPYGHSHGQVPIIAPSDFRNLSCFIGSDSEIKLTELLFIDTETSSISTGAGSFVFLVGLSWFDESGLNIRQIFLDHPEEELYFLSSFDDLISKFTTFVSYNGKAFDIPMLKSRYILNKLPLSLDQFHHFDLLHTARRIWKLRLDSRKLSDLEREIILFSRNAEDIPGWLIPQIYFDYLDSGDASPLKGVFYHNEMDVISLTALFLHVNAMVSDQQTIASVNSLDIYSIGNILEKMGLLELSETFFNLGLQEGIPDEYKVEVFREYARVLKRQGKWTEAQTFWEFAASDGDWQSCIELAKYFEHHTKNVKQAMEWVTKGTSIIYQKGLSSELITAVEHRQARLERKQKKDDDKK